MGVGLESRQPQCPGSGAEAVESAVTAHTAGDSSIAYRAPCPKCKRLLWLSKQGTGEIEDLTLTFPEHIGTTVEL